MQKSKKNFKPKIPWWEYEPFLNFDKGWWKIFQRRKERALMKKDTKRQIKEM